MSFRISGLDPMLFRPLFALTDEELVERGGRRYVADQPVGFPDRVTLRDASVGDRVLLVNYLYQPAATPYRGTHAIYVNESASVPFDAVDDVPPALRSRLLSLRAFDADHMMIDADIVEGAVVEAMIARLFDNERTQYLQAHFARRGCFAARIDRA
jgi:hypothetical protein